MTSLIRPINARDNVRGNSSGRVKVVEYGDYECPYCARAELVTHELLRRYGRDVTYAFRNFPLVHVHPHALLAAEAAEAAGAQGRFWPMHALLFQNQDNLEMAALVRYAQAIDLDLARFVSDIQTEVHLTKIRNDVTDGEQSGVNGTPTFFIDGVRQDGPWDFDSLASAIEAATQPPPSSQLHA